MIPSPCGSGENAVVAVMTVRWSLFSSLKKLAPATSWLGCQVIGLQVEAGRVRVGDGVAKLVLSRKNGGPVRRFNILEAASVSEKAADADSWRFAVT